MLNMLNVALALKRNLKPETTPETRPDGRPYWVDQPKQTLAGHPIREIPWTLPYSTQSLCPECAKVIKARKFEEDGKVWMEKTCQEHGYIFSKTYP